MAKIQSQSEQTENSIRDFFVPTFAAGVLIFLVGTLFLLAYNSTRIIDWVGDNYTASANKAPLSLNILDSGFTRLFSSTLNGRPGQIIFWSVIGATVYIAVWFGRNLLNSFENDVIVDHYTHPSGYDRKGYWSSAIAGMVFFAAVLILLLAYTFIGLRVLMPSLAALTSSSIYHFRLLAGTGYIILSVILSAVSVYIWALLAQLLGRLWERR